MSILALAVTTLLPRALGGSKTDLTNAARFIGLHVRTVADRAIWDRKGYLLKWDLGAQQLQTITIQTDGLERAASDPLIRQSWMFPAHVTLLAVWTTKAGREERGTIRTAIGPTGQIEETILYLETPARERMSVHLFPRPGHMKVTPGEERPPDRDGFLS